MTYKRLLAVLAIVLMTVSVNQAQITVPNTFIPAATIKSADVNSNFTTLANAALNRSGGNITGNITVDPGITIDGIDIGATVCVSCTPTFGALTVTGTSTFGAVTVTSITKGGLPIGSPNATAKSTTYSAVAGDFVLCTGTFTVTLPVASSNINAVIDIKNVSTGVITIASAGGNIDGASTVTEPIQYQSYTLFSDGTNWWIR